MEPKAKVFSQYEAERKKYWSGCFDYLIDKYEYEDESDVIDIRTMTVVKYGGSREKGCYKSFGCMLEYDNISGTETLHMLKKKVTLLCMEESDSEETESETTFDDIESSEELSSEEVSLLEEDLELSEEKKTESSLTPDMHKLENICNIKDCFVKLTKLNVTDIEALTKNACHSKKNESVGALRIKNKQNKDNTFSRKNLKDSCGFLEKSKLNNINSLKVDMESFKTTITGTIPVNPHFVKIHDIHAPNEPCSVPSKVISNGNTAFGSVRTSKKLKKKDIRTNRYKFKNKQNENHTLSSDNLKILHSLHEKNKLHDINSSKVEFESFKTTDTRTVSVKPCLVKVHNTDIKALTNNACHSKKSETVGASRNKNKQNNGNTFSVDNPKDSSGFFEKSKLDNINSLNVDIESFKTASTGTVPVKPHSVKIHKEHASIKPYSYNSPFSSVPSKLISNENKAFDCMRNSKELYQNTNRINTKEHLLKINDKINLNFIKSQGNNNLYPTIKNILLDEQYLMFKKTSNCDLNVSILQEITKSCSIKIKKTKGKEICESVNTYSSSTALKHHNTGQIKILSYASPPFLKEKIKKEVIGNKKIFYSLL